MNRLYFIKNPEVFQGEKYLKTNKSYFEGWYFKNVSDENGISFIPGINIDKDNKKAFIKDWGTSFPKGYIWCQGNNFKNKEVSFMMSIANIPFKVFEFTGLICDILINDKEFKFTTYNNAKIINYFIDDNLLSIILKQKDYFLEVKSKFDKGLKLTVPVKGKMQKDIFETILANIAVTLRLKNEIIFSDTSSNCGLEIVKFDK